MISSEISYTEAQSNLGVLLDRVADNKDIIVIQRNGKSKNVALIAEEDLSSLMETLNCPIFDFNPRYLRKIFLITCNDSTSN
jgi:prevent-host-death family protein